MSRHYSVESLNEIAGGDQEFMAVVAKTFLEEIPPDLRAMEEAIHNDNKELAYQFAHKMKPNLEMFGIDVIKDITSIESWTRTSKNKIAVTANLDKIIAAVKAVLGELKDDFNL